MTHLSINDIRITADYYDDEPTMIANIEFTDSDGNNTGYYYNKNTGEHGFVSETDFDALFDNGLFDNLISGKDYDYIHDYTYIENADDLNSFLHSCGLSLGEPLNANNTVYTVQAAY